MLFAIGTTGVLLRRNLITILLSIEIMLNAVNLSFVAFVFNVTMFSDTLSHLTTFLERVQQVHPDRIRPRIGTE